MTDTLCITCGSPVRIVGGVTQSYEPITAHDRSYVRVVAENDKLREQVKVMREALEFSVNGLWNDSGTCFITPTDGLKLELHKQALARCEELEKTE